MNPWFKINGYNAQWLDHSPANKVSRCDTCRENVAADMPRLRVDTGTGPNRKRSKGSKLLYMCKRCGDRRIEQDDADRT